MSREVRRVPADWVHPSKWYPPQRPGSDSQYGISQARLKPLLSLDKPFEVLLADWHRDNAAWKAGTHEDCREPDGTRRDFDFAEWAGALPVAADYMPWWPPEQCTHLQMYETCTEGTPISPVMPDPESLAHWLANNGASSMGYQTASYESWLATIHRGWSPSMVGIIRNNADGSTTRALVSGVEAATLYTAPLDTAPPKRGF